MAVSTSTLIATTSIAAAMKAMTLAIMEVAVSPM